MAEALLRDATPILDDARLSLAHSWGMVSDDAAIGIFKTLEGTGLLRFQDYRKWDGLEGNEAFGALGPRASRVLSDELHHLRQEMDFDPGDGNTLMSYINTLKYHVDMTGEPLPLDEFHTRFGNLFAISPYDGGAWVQFAWYSDLGTGKETMSLADVDRLRGYYENAVAYSNQDRQVLHYLDNFNRQVWTAMDKRNQDAFDVSGAPEFAADAYNRSIVCPAVRAIRIIEAICPKGSNAQGCQVFPEGADPHLDLLARAQKRQTCTDELAADPDDLVYSPVSVDIPSAP